MTWTIKRPKRDEWYWIRNAASDGWETMVAPQMVEVYGFSNGEPTVTLPSQENCSDLADIDAEWFGPLEVPA